MPFFAGDKVRHKLCPAWTGEVVRVGPEVMLEGRPHENNPGPARQIYWKGWDPFDPEKVDWTWDFAMEGIYG